MKVLVTDVTSLVGLALVRHLIESPDVDRILAATPIPSRVFPSDQPKVTVVAADLARPRQLHDLLFGPARAHGIDTVVHGPLVQSALATGHRVHSLNVDAARELMLACERHPTVRRLVYRSSADVYAVGPAEPNLLDEDQPLEFDPAAPQRVHDQVEADLTVCAHLASPLLSIRVLRCAEVLEPGTGSQLWDYLQTRVCLRPLGFDPMINILSLSDCVQALARALRSRRAGIYNVPGADTAPLSRIIRYFSRVGLPVPGPLLAPLYRLRARAVGLEFRYDMNMRRFHFGGVLDGSRARLELGYQPSHPIHWPPARPPRRTVGGAVRA